MLADFLIKPFLALSLITICCSLIGVFILWKKMAYFSDAMSHSILLGLVLGAFFSFDPIWTLIIFSLLFSLIFSLLSTNKYFSSDSLIAISAYFCIALAGILNDMWFSNLGLNSYVFGDILAVTKKEIFLLSFLAILIIFYVIFSLRKILLININEDLAKISGTKINLWNFSFLAIFSLSIAIIAKIVGVFLMSALFILPAAIARLFSNSHQKMILLSLVLGIIISSASFFFAASFDLAIVPFVIASFCLVFVFGICQSSLKPK